MQPDPADREQRDRELFYERKPLSLRLYPDPVLREKCEPIDRFDTWLTGVVEEMLALMRCHAGIGLAGPQASLVKRLFVAELNGQVLCLANPAVHTRAGTERMTEGCLSLPGLQVTMDRAFQVEMHGYGMRGMRQEYRLQGLWARVVQHEIDHLDGILIGDYQRPVESRSRGARR